MLNYRLRIFCTASILLVVSMMLFAKSPVRIKDIVYFDGVRDNQLSGFGLVVGLQGKGDTKAFTMTRKMLANLAMNHGFNVTVEDINSKNIAAVLVTSQIGPFTRQGDHIDITISSIGDSKSLEGGVLLQTPLKGADGVVYAVAQGKIISGKGDQSAQANATVPDGAIMERPIVSSYMQNGKISLMLKYPDFVTASQIKEAILSLNPELSVNAIDAGLVELTLAGEFAANPVDFIAQLEVLTVTPDYTSAVVIDKKTGVIVMGGDIIVQECSVSTPMAQVTVGKNEKEKDSHLALSGQTIKELVKVLNESGLQTDEIISVIESIHKIGAINAKIIVM